MGALVGVFHVSASVVLCAALCSHLLFCGLFLLVLFLQRDTAVAFNVERVLTDSMFSEVSRRRACVRAASTRT